MRNDWLWRMVGGGRSPLPQALHHLDRPTQSHLSLTCISSSLTFTYTSEAQRRRGGLSVCVLCASLPLFPNFRALPPYTHTHKYALPEHGLGQPHLSTLPFLFSFLTWRLICIHPLFSTRHPCRCSPCFVRSHPSHSSHV